MASETGAGRVLPERVTMGLLPYLNAHALDEDYEQAAARRARSGVEHVRRVGRGGALMLAVFAVLAITAAVQTSRNSTTDESERQSLIAQLKERTATVAVERHTISALTASNARLEASLLRSSADSSGVFANLNLLGLRSGITPAHGPGVQVTVDDAVNAPSDRNKVLDTDMQKLVNGLWQAGAEAISINGERLTALSPIRHAGSAITVNFTSLRRPYVILAIGNPDTLPSRFANTSSGQAWLDLQQQVGLRFAMRTESSMSLPGADVPDLRFVTSMQNPPNGKGIG
ncbi:MAG: hypothetical protein JWQ32_3531 [Marmoricola sp.]|nr:hypothetical protein [Marmoricola sp.]